jgi:hypothetical protein
VGVSFKTALGSNFNNTSGTSLVITTTAAIAVDDLVVVRWAADNLTATTPTATCADGGNTYSVLIQGGVNATAAAGCVGGILVTKATVARASGSSITLTLSGAVAGKAAYAESFTGALTTVRSAAVSATGTVAAAAVAASGTVNAGDLVLGTLSNETRALPTTGDTDTLNGSWSTLVKVAGGGTSGQDATSVTVAGQYKITTASGAQTYNFTAVASEWWMSTVVLQAAPEPSITQAAYGFYDDAGTESGAAALAAANTAINGDIVNGDGFGVLRVRLQITANAGFATDDYQLQWEKNANGTWTNITTGGTTVLAYNNPNLTDVSPTTNRLGAGTGSYSVGLVSETGDVANFPIPASSYTELVYSLTLKAVNLAAGDTLRFRVTRNGVTTQMTYTQTPLINIIRSAQNITATITDNWGGWSTTTTAGVEHPATVATNWGTWTATATGDVTSAAVDRPATITDNWGTWTATAAGAPDRAATGASAWGTWTATATALAIDHPASTVTAWGTWTATATVAFIERYGTITSSWGTWSATGTATVFTPASWTIPQNVLATTTGQTTITVTWDAVPAATGYDIERNSAVIVLNHPASPYNDSGLTPDTLYTYRVRAVG